MGSGRRPKYANGANGANGAATNGASSRVTFGKMFATVPAPAPVAAPDTAGHPTAPGPPAAATPAPPPPPGIERAGNRPFAHLVGYVSANLGVSVIGDHLRRRGLEPREPSSEDLERVTETTEDAVVNALGDLAVPWWAAIVASWGNLYLSMRVGAKPLTAATAGATTTTTPTASPLASPAIPVRRPATPPPRPGGSLPAVEVTSS